MHHIIKGKRKLYAIATANVKSKKKWETKKKKTKNMTEVVRLFVLYDLLKRRTQHGKTY